MKIHTDYLNKIFNPDLFKQAVAGALIASKEIIKKYGADTVAFQGHSGCAVGFVVAYTLNLPMICVRKPGASSHFQEEFEGNLGVKKYFIIDDFIASGDTIKNICRVVQSRTTSIWSTGAECVAVLLYKDTDIFNDPLYTRTINGVTMPVVHSFPR